MDVQSEVGTDPQTLHRGSFLWSWKRSRPVLDLTHTASGEGRHLWNIRQFPSSKPLCFDKKFFLWATVWNVGLCTRWMPAPLCCWPMGSRGCARHTAVCVLLLSAGNGLICNDRLMICIWYGGDIMRITFSLKDIIILVFAEFSGLWVTNTEEHTSLPVSEQRQCEFFCYGSDFDKRHKRKCISAEGLCPYEKATLS